MADFIFGGMENTTATTLTDTILYDERAALDFDADALVAHELAHQWFGDLLTCRDWAEGWLNEGFATYSEYLWREAHEGRDEADHELDEWGEQYFAEDAGRYRRIIATNVYDEPIDIFDHHLYEKGGRVLHMLRQVLGDDSFFRALKHYLGKHRGGSVETRDLARAVEDATGRQMDWFFDQWIVKGAGHPELEVGYEWDADKQLACFTVKQTHKVEGSTPLFRMPVSLSLEVDGARRVVEIEVSEQQHTFYVTCDREPSQAIFDPGKAVLARVKTEKPAPMWIAELAGAELAIDRVYAARELGTRGGARATEALVEALRGDSSWTVQAAAADALGKLRSDAARDALIAAVDGTKHPRARRAVVRALGQYRGDEKAGAAVAEVVERGDASYFVEAEACLSLGRTRWPVAGDLLEAGGGARLVPRRHPPARLPRAGRGARRGGGPLPAPGDRVRQGVARAPRGGGRPGRAGPRPARPLRARGARADRGAPARRRLPGAVRGARVAGGSVRCGVGAGASRRHRARAGRAAAPAREEIVRDIGEARNATAEVSSLRDDVEKLRGDLARLREQLERMQAADAPRDGVRPRNGAPARRAATVKDTVRRPGKAKVAARGKRRAKTKSSR